MPASRAKRASRRWARGRSLLPKGGASKSSKVAPSAWPSDPGLATSICEKSMTSRQPTAQCPRGRSPSIRTPPEGEKLAQVLVGHSAAGVTFRLSRKRLSGSYRRFTTASRSRVAAG